MWCTPHWGFDASGESSLAATPHGMINARELIGTHDVLFMTLDALRYDVATRTLGEGRTPNLAGVLALGGWEMRHTPGSFTFG